MLTYSIGRDKEKQRVHEQARTSLRLASKKVENELMRKYWWVPFSLVIVLWSVVGGILFWYFIGNDAATWAKVGQSGDMFGSLNTLFSGLAFAGVLLALWMQREDLKLQRKEMQETRREMEKQTKIQKTTAAMQMVSASLPLHIEKMKFAYRQGEQENGHHGLSFWVHILIKKIHYLLLNKLQRR